MLRRLIILMMLRTSLSNVTQVSSKATTRHKSSTVPVTTELPTTSEFSTETDFNVSTFFNTTMVPIITPNRTITTPQKPKVNRHQDQVSCLCDLRRNSCDIGCCCDKDCTYRNKKIFDSCDKVIKTNVDRSACQYSEIDYVNFTVHEWEIQNNDFFCVVKTNLPPAYTLQKDKPFRNYAESRLEKSTGDFWPIDCDESYKEINFSEPYVQTVSIKLVINNSTRGIFRLCESFFTSGCDLQSDISFLNDFDSQCVQLLNEDNNFLDANFYGKNLFVAKPDVLNVTLFENKLLTCSAPICLKPYMKICTDVHLMNCRDANASDISFRCQKREESITCVNIVDSLRFSIVHNGIEGIKNITLFLHLVNVTRRLDIRQYEINQRITVNYEWSSSMTNYSDILSGNPGYLVGRPILIGTLVNGTIQRNPQNYEDNFMILPHEDMGVCRTGRYSYQPIEFGYSTMLWCKIEGSISVANASKAADICKKIQLDVFRYWYIEEVNGYFMNRTYGLFGNAITSILEDWNEIIYEKSPKEVFHNITGKFSNKNTTLTCYGLVFGMSIDIFHAKVDLKKLVDQEKILGITNQFHLTSNKSSTFNISNHTLVYDLDLDTRVAFWDKTSQKSRRLLGPPSLNIKLPSDFFYPFVKMGNVGGILVPKFYLLFVSLVLSLTILC